MIPALTLFAAFALGVPSAAAYSCIAPDGRDLSFLVSPSDMDGYRFTEGALNYHFELCSGIIGGCGRDPGAALCVSPGGLPASGTWAKSSTGSLSMVDNGYAFYFYDRTGIKRRVVISIKCDPNAGKTPGSWTASPSVSATGTGMIEITGYSSGVCRAPCVDAEGNDYGRLVSPDGYYKASDIDLVRSRHDSKQQQQQQRVNSDAGAYTFNVCSPLPEAGVYGRCAGMEGVAACRYSYGNDDSVSIGSASSQLVARTPDGVEFLYRGGHDGASTIIAFVCERYAPKYPTGSNWKISFNETSLQYKFIASTPLACFAWN